MWTKILSLQNIIGFLKLDAVRAWINRVSGAVMMFFVGKGIIDNNTALLILGIFWSMIGTPSIQQDIVTTKLKAQHAELQAQHAVLQSQVQTVQTPPPLVPQYVPTPPSPVPPIVTVPTVTGGNSPPWTSTYH